MNRRDTDKKRETVISFRVPENLHEFLLTDAINDPQTTMTDIIKEAIQSLLKNEHPKFKKSTKAE